MMTRPMFQHRRRFLAALCTASLFAAPAWACGEDATHKAPAKKTAWVKLAQKHNGSGVQVRYSRPSVLQVGQASTVRLEFSGVSTDAGAAAEIKAHSGVTLSGATSVTLQSGRATSVEVQVAATSEGRHYIDVFTTQGGRTSVQSIPLQVGNAKPQLKTTGKPETTPSGEKVISLPSQ